MNIVIVDYGLGNLKSVYNACISLGANAKISDSPGDISKADKIVLPGVGAFQDTIEEMHKRDIMEAIKKFIKSGKLYLGICLGLQILFESSEEGSSKGLSIFKGTVKRFKQKPGLKIPHMGWNSVGVKNNHAVMKRIVDNAYFYFVHSYYADPDDKEIIVGETTYGGVDFASLVIKDNIYATQFHPEKSQELGLRFLKNFVAL